jgi:hypothetical protein
MSLRKIITSWDFILAALLSATGSLFLPPYVRNTVAKDFYGVGISVLAIVFSVFFAALAIIMSSSDDEFVKFLEQESGYSKIIAAFRFTLLALFVALIASLMQYAYASARIEGGVQYQSRWFLTIFQFLSVYGLLAALAAALDSISYARYRSKFLSMRSHSRNEAAPSAKTGPSGEPAEAKAGTPAPDQRRIASRLCGEEGDRKLRRFQTASDVRKFEIDLFWKRALFFWGFVASAFVAIAALKGEQSLLSLFISEFGVTCSLAWTLANRGSKYWQEQWESKIEQVEDDITGPLFKHREPAQENKGWWLRGRRFSVSKLATAVSDSVALVWAAIYFRQVWICLTYGTPGGLSKASIWLISLACPAYCLLVAICGKSDDPQYQTRGRSPLNPTKRD